MRAGPFAVVGTILLVMGLALRAISKSRRPPEWRTLSDVPVGSKIGFGQNPILRDYGLILAVGGVLLLVIAVILYVA